MNLQSANTTHTFRPSTSSPAPLTCLALSSVFALAQGGQSLSRTLFAGSWDKCVYSWQLYLDAEGKVIGAKDGPTFRGHTDFVKALVTANVGGKSLLISASADATIIIWDTQTGARLHTLKGHSRGVQALGIDPVSISPESVILYSGDSNREIRAWHITPTTATQISTGQAQQAVDDGSVTPLTAHETSIFALRFELSCDSEFDIWTASADKTAKCLSRMRNWAPDTVLQHPDFVRDIVIDEIGNYVITACRDEEVRIWCKASAKLVHTFSGHFEEVTGLTIVSVGKWRGVVSVSIDGTVRKWSLKPADLKKAVEDAKTGVEEKPKPKDEKPKESMLTAEEEAELAELMDEDD
jgi:WD40 repeat protein